MISREILRGTLDAAAKGDKEHAHLPARRQRRALRRTDGGDEPAAHGGLSEDRAGRAGKGAGRRDRIRGRGFDRHAPLAVCGAIVVARAWRASRPRWSNGATATKRPMPAAAIVIEFAPVPAAPAALDRNSAGARAGDVGRFAQPADRERGGEDRGEGRAEGRGEARAEGRREGRHQAGRRAPPEVAPAPNPEVAIAPPPPQEVKQETPKRQEPRPPAPTTSAPQAIPDQVGRDSGCAHAGPDHSPIERGCRPGRLRWWRCWNATSAIRRTPNRAASRAWSRFSSSLDRKGR